MDKINNLYAYLTRMDAALADKCWWLDYIDSDIDTVIDFGCAAGSLHDMINLLAPNEYNYFGVDNSAEMRALCAEKCIQVYETLDEVLPQINPDKTVLIMNSVIHEILSYSDTYMALFHKINEANFKHIAIREMYIDDEYIILPNKDRLIETIEHSSYADKWKEFKWTVEHNRWGDYLNPNVYITEFLLKYWYTENWNRECKEQYLWNWEKFFLKTKDYDAMSYYIAYQETFKIPYVINKIYKDFKYGLPKNTHKKLLLTNIKFLH